MPVSRRFLYLHAMFCARRHSPFSFPLHQLRPPAADGSGRREVSAAASPRRMKAPGADFGLSLRHEAWQLAAASICRLALQLQ